MARALPGKSHLLGSCLLSNVTPTPRAAGTTPQYLLQGVDHASLLSVVPRGLPGRVAEGRWTWLRVALQGQKPLEEIVAFGCTQALAGSCTVLGEGGGR